MFTFRISCQENAVVLQRTPEQEADKQTEKLQQELNLSSEQARQVYEINLRYARERRISNKRSEALERTRNKNVEIQRILSSDQNYRLQSKRYERTSIEQTLNRNMPVNSSTFRSPTQYRTRSMDYNQKNNGRPVSPNFQYRNQPVRRGYTPNSRSMQNQNNQGSMRSTGPTRGGYVAPSSSNNSSSRSSTPSTSTRGVDTPVNTNRR
jgi:hypothetical protein